MSFKSSSQRFKHLRLSSKTPLRLLRVFALFFFFGVVVWAVQIRLVEVGFKEDQSKQRHINDTFKANFIAKKYVIVLLTEVGEDSEVVFQYPHIESPFYLGRVLSFKKKRGYKLDLEQEVFLPKQLILGRVLYKF